MTSPFTAGQKVRASELNTNVTSAWTPLTLVVGSNLGGGFQTAQYRKVADRVEFRGTITGATLNSVFATLPVGFRPPAIEIMTYVTDTSPGNVYIYPNGEMKRITGPVSWTPLAGLWFSTV